jgi:hypothetical protein
MEVGVHPSMPEPPMTGFSANGYWWWDGRQWLPAFTPDRLWRFTGERWVRVSPRSRPPRWLVVTGLGWLAALVGWLLYGAVMLAILGEDDPGRLTVYVLLGLAAVAVLATVGWGFLVGRRRASRWLWKAAAVGTAALMFSYAVAMLAAPASADSTTTSAAAEAAADSTQDIAAGAGVVILIVPTAVIVLALLWFGAGLGALSRRVNR